MSNLAAFLNGMAEGVIEQAERIEVIEGETTESLALRDYFSQMVKVAEHTDWDTELVDWAAIESEIGVDLDLIEAWQVMLDETPQGSPHLNIEEANGHVEGLKRIPREREVRIWINAIYLNKE